MLVEKWNNVLTIYMQTPCKDSHRSWCSSCWFCDGSIPNEAAGGLQFQGLASSTDGGQTVVTS